MKTLPLLFLLVLFSCTDKQDKDVQNELSPKEVYLCAQGDTILLQDTYRNIEFGIRAKNNKDSIIVDFITGQKVIIQVGNTITYYRQSVFKEGIFIEPRLNFGNGVRTIQILRLRLRTEDFSLYPQYFSNILKKWNVEDLGEMPKDKYLEEWFIHHLREYTKDQDPMAAQYAVDKVSKILGRDDISDLLEPSSTQDDDTDKISPEILEKVGILIKIIN